jgi:hypothetical protein
MVGRACFAFLPAAFCPSSLASSPLVRKALDRSDAPPARRRRRAFAVNGDSSPAIEILD